MGSLCFFVHPSYLDLGKINHVVGRFCLSADYRVVNRLNGRRKDLIHCVHVRIRVQIPNPF